MRVVAYARLENDANQAAFVQALETFVGDRTRWQVDPKIHYDGLSGVQGLRKALRQAAGADFFLVATLADLGRDLRELLENINLFAAAPRPTLFVLEDQIAFASAHYGLAAALRSALEVHGRRRRLIGISAARATGTRIGRPRRYRLEKAASLIDLLADEGKPLTVRSVAKKLGCSVGAAQRLLREYLEERRPKTLVELAEAGKL